MILQGHVIDVLRSLEAESVQCIVTSPPYWGLRDYGLPPSVWGGDLDCSHEWGDQIVERSAGYESNSKTRWNHQVNGRGEVQEDKRERAGWTRLEFSHGSVCQRCGAWCGVLGLEPTPEMFVEHLVDVFAEVWRVLAKDGTVWLNLGDTYATGAGQGFIPGGGGQGNRWLRTHDHWQPNRLAIPGLKKKDRVGIPHRTVLALQAWGWWWRDEIVWHKPNPMPSSTPDRTTPAHEMVFLLTKSARYYYDGEAIQEPCASGPSGVYKMLEGKERIGGKHVALIDPYNAASSATNIGHKRAVGGKPLAKQDGHGAAHVSGGDRFTGFNGRWDAAEATGDVALGRNRRSVWTIATAPFREAHFATFPEALVKPCVLAGSRPGDVVLDPFAGSGTVGVVAKAFGREFVGIELNPEYAAMAERRIAAQNPALPFEAVG